MGSVVSGPDRITIPPRTRRREGRGSEMSSRTLRFKVSLPDTCPAGRRSGTKP